MVNAADKSGRSSEVDRSSGGYSNITKPDTNPIVGFSVELNLSGALSRNKSTSWRTHSVACFGLRGGKWLQDDSADYKSLVELAGPSTIPSVRPNLRPTRCSLAGSRCLWRNILLEASEVPGGAFRKAEGRQNDNGGGAGGHVFCGPKAKLVAVCGNGVTQCRWRGTNLSLSLSGSSYSGKSAGSFLQKENTTTAGNRKRSRQSFQTASSSFSSSLYRLVV